MPVPVWPGALPGGEGRMRKLFLAAAIAAAGCDRDPPTSPAVVTATITITENIPNAPPPPAVDTLRESEEKRLARLDGELRLMSTNVRNFVESARATLKKRPFGAEALELPIGD